MNHNTSCGRNIQRLVPGHTIYLALAGAMVFSCTVRAYAQQNQPETPEASVARVNAGNFSNADIDTVMHAGASRRVLPQLEQQFARADASERGWIARDLVKLGDGDNSYWNFLLEEATLAVDSDLPDPYPPATTDPKNPQLSPEFKAWIRAHNVDVSTAINSALFDLPGKVMVLGGTGDPRGIPLLRRALKSHNYQIVAWAAKGLAKIQDKDSIPLIMTSLRSAPSAYAPLIAESLVYFDDPQAQSAVDSYMPKEKADMARQERARGRDVFGW